MKKIMIIDDEPAIREALVDLLSDDNCKVFDFATANQALDRITTETFDLIITDLRMPGIDGLEFMSRLRQRNVPTPIILMTAFAAKETIKRAWDLGAVEFLEKPVQFDKLRELVSGFLQDGTFSSKDESFAAKDIKSHRSLDIHTDQQNLALNLSDAEFSVLNKLAQEKGQTLEFFIKEYIKTNLINKKP